MATQQAQTEYAAPGHAYIEKLGTGIQWLPGIARLWERGQVSLEAEHHTQSPFEFWYELAFANTFPQVTHWWFRSAWTQRVRLTRAQGMLDQATVWGYMQFIDDDDGEPGQIWTVEERDVPVIETPYPPNEVQPVNLPLRLALARLVAGVFSDGVVPDQWMVVTSLVERVDLALVFPTSVDAHSYRLAGVESNLRDELCRVQGIKPSRKYPISRTAQNNPQGNT